MNRKRKKKDVDVFISKEMFFFSFLCPPFLPPSKQNVLEQTALFTPERAGLISALAIKMEEETRVVSPPVLSGCVLPARAPCPQALLPQVPETFQLSAPALRYRNAGQPLRPSRRSSPGPGAAGTCFCPPRSPSSPVALGPYSLHSHPDPEPPRLRPSLPGCIHLTSASDADGPTGCTCARLWPPVGGPRQNPTDLPLISCGTQGT